MLNQTDLYLSLLIFLFTVILIIWRPFRVNESVPAAVGAVAIYAIGIVNWADVYKILGIVSGAAITILSTIVMSIVLESIGFFRWAAYNLAVKAKGSGTALYWYINLLCFLMTMFFNNDGSILITTPIIIQTLTMLNLKSNQKIPYLISGALIATGSSAPIGVSNLANLIALKIVNLDLNMYASMMFVPSMLGLLTISLMLYRHFKKVIPVRIPTLHPGSLGVLQNYNVIKRYHPLMVDSDDKTAVDWGMFKISIVIVVLTRISFFALAPFGISTEWPAIIGAVSLIVIRWKRKKTGAFDILRQTPWHILIFAFSTYMIVYGLHKSGLTAIIIDRFGELMSESRFNAIFIMGILLTVLSNLCNNLPSVMIGTLSLTEINLDPGTLHAAYLANIIGADIGSLILPMGTLASLIWMFLLRTHKIPFSWGQYLKTTIMVIPIALLVSLLSLYLWIMWLF